MNALLTILKIIIIVAGILLALIFAWLIVTAIDRKKKIAALMEKTKRGDGFVPQLIRTTFRRAKMFRNASLPEPERGGTFVTAESDLIYVDSCGIAVMTLCGLSGAVDNPSSGNWTVKNKNGSFEIRNPFEKNAHAINALSSILKEEGVYDVPMYSLAVFYGKKTVFKNQSEKILTADNLLETLRDINKEQFFTPDQVTEAANAIKKNLPKQQKIKLKEKKRK